MQQSSKNDASPIRVHHAFAVNKPHTNRSDLDMYQQRRDAQERSEEKILERNMSAYLATCTALDYQLGAVGCLLNEAERQFIHHTGGTSCRPSIPSIVSRRAFHRKLSKLGLVWQMKLRRELLSYHQVLAEIGQQNLFGFRQSILKKSSASTSVTKQVSTSNPVHSSI